MTDEVKEVSSEFQWYVVRAITGQEQKVKRYIETELERANLLKFVPTILIPMEKVYKVKDGKKTSRDKSFFPGYILVNAHLKGEVAPIIKSINGVVGFLGSGGEPIPLRQAEVNRILGTVDEMSEQADAGMEPYVIGELVKVTDGPFNGFSGVIEEVNEEKKKLKVMVKIFGRKTPMELNYIQVDKE
jgi:transcriptional antiterminator NusG